MNKEEAWHQDLFGTRQQKEQNNMATKSKKNSKVSKNDGTKKIKKSKKTETETPRRTRTKREAVPMPKEVRVAAAAGLTAFEEKLLDQEGIGFDGSNTKELKGSRSGMQTTVKMEGEDGARFAAVITVVFKARAPRKARAAGTGRRRRKAAETDSE